MNQDLTRETVESNKGVSEEELWLLAEKVLDDKFALNIFSDEIKSIIQQIIQRPGELTSEKRANFLLVLEERFSEPSEVRVQGVDFSEVKAALENDPKYIDSLYNAEQKLGAFMELTDFTEDELEFTDCAVSLDIDKQRVAVKSLIKELVAQGVDIADVTNRSYIEDNLWQAEEGDLDRYDASGVNYYEVEKLFNSMDLEQITSTSYANISKLMKRIDSGRKSWFRTDQTDLEDDKAFHARIREDGVYIHSSHPGHRAGHHGGRAQLRVKRVRN